MCVRWTAGNFLDISSPASTSFTIVFVSRASPHVWFFNPHTNARWLGKAGFCAGLAAVVLGLHSGWGLRSLGGTRGVWALTAGVVGVFFGIVAAKGDGKSPERKA